MADSDERLIFADPASAWYGPYGARPGIQRDDQSIASDAVLTLQNDPSVDTADLELSVDAGVVTVTGLVASSTMKRTVEADIWDTPGVTEVRNGLNVPQDGATTENV